LGWGALHLRGETIERLRQRPSNIAALGMGGTRAISKTSFCRAARFGNSLPVLSHLAALEGCLSGQGTRGDGLNRCPGCAGLRTAFAQVCKVGFTVPAAACQGLEALPVAEAAVRILGGRKWRLLPARVGNHRGDSGSPSPEDHG